MQQFKTDGSKAWILYGDFDKNIFVYLKYDIVPKKVISLKNLYKINEYTDPAIADLNFDYIVYTNKDNLQFRKIF